MRRVGLYLAQLAAARVVEIQHQLRIAGTGFGRGHVFHAVAFPQATGSAESVESTVGADTGTSQHHTALAGGSVRCCHAPIVRDSAGEDISGRAGAGQGG